MKYDYQYYNLTYRTTFNVNKKSYIDKVELLNISGLAYTNEQNNLTLIFNKNIESRYLSEFIFTDKKQIILIFQISIVIILIIL